MKRSLPFRSLYSKLAPITEQGNLEGYLYVILGGEIYDGIVQKLKGSFIFKLSVWVILGSLLFALFAGLSLPC